MAVGMYLKWNEQFEILYMSGVIYIHIHTYISQLEDKTVLKMHSLTFFIEKCIAFSMVGYNQAGIFFLYCKYSFYSPSLFLIISLKQTLFTVTGFPWQCLFKVQSSLAVPLLICFGPIRTDNLLTLLIQGRDLEQAPQLNFPASCEKC